MKTFILIIAAAASLGIPKPITADINEDMLKQHNDYRKKHNANDLSIDDEVSSSCCNSLPGEILEFCLYLQLMISAQEWADHLAATNCQGDCHTPQADLNMNGVCVGENLYSSTGDESSAIDATRAWYCEVDDYKENPYVWTTNPAIGHFTQVNAHFYSLPKKNWESCHCHSRWCGKTPRGLALALPEAAMDGPEL